MKSTLINKRRSKDIQKTLRDKDPRSILGHRKNTMGPEIVKTMNNLMYVRINNFHSNSKTVRIEHEGGSGKYYTFEVKSFFEHIKDDKYKCLICNSFVYKILSNGLDVFINADGAFHRKKIRRNRERGMICNFDTTITITEKKKHIGHMKPNDNSFMTIE